MSERRARRRARTPGRTRSTGGSCTRGRCSSGWTLRVSQHVASRAHEATPETVRRAVEVARRARRVWRRMPYRERLAHLAAVAGAISERHLELAAVMSLETGKSRIEAIVEVQEAIELIETYSEEMERHDGFVAAAAELHPSRARHRDAQALRRVRGDRPLQLPARAHGGDDRGRADRRQHRRRQALRGDSLDGRAAGRGDARRRASSRRLQPDPRRPRDRSRAGRVAPSTGSPSPAPPRSGARSRTA